MDEKTGYLESRGARLYTRWWTGVEPRAGVVLVHGFAEHSGRYQHVGERLVQAGMSVLAFDYRGHGRANGRRNYIGRYEDYLVDLDAALALARETLGSLPLFVLGHSQGGLISLSHSQSRQPDLAGLALSCPALGFAVTVPAWKQWLGRAASRLWPSLAIPSGLDAKWLSHDESVVQAYEADPLIHEFATARWYTESLEAQQRAFEAVANLRVPTLVMQGADDHIVDPAAVRRFVETMGAGEQRYIEYPGLYHEIFNEPEHAKVLDDLVAWLDARI